MINIVLINIVLTVFVSANTVFKKSRVGNYLFPIILGVTLYIILLDSVRAGHS